MEAPSPRTLGSHLPATLKEDTKSSEVTPMSASSLHPATQALTEMKTPRAGQVSLWELFLHQGPIPQTQALLGGQESHCKGQKGGPRLWVWCSTVAQ